MEASLFIHTHIITFSLTAAPLKTQSSLLSKGTKAPENSIQRFLQKKGEVDKLQNENLDSSLSEFLGESLTSLLEAETRFVCLFLSTQIVAKLAPVQSCPEFETVSWRLGHAWGHVSQKMLGCAPYPAPSVQEEFGRATLLTLLSFPPLPLPPSSAPVVLFKIVSPYYVLGSVLETAERARSKPDPLSPSKS